ncbi:hypothetical protein T492DRAFT_895232 [Pavlovales sp. CCMP2436]|nr:hypothetical protein T492DRAFT_895232 [Pavlovales sp. CCMP2436]
MRQEIGMCALRGHAKVIIARARMENIGGGGAAHGGADDDGTEDLRDAPVRAPLALLAPNVGVSVADQQGRSCAVSLEHIVNAVRFVAIGWLATITEQDQLSCILLDKATGSEVARRVLISRDGTFLVEVRGVIQADMAVLGPEYPCRCADAGWTLCECLTPLLSSPDGSTPAERALSVLRLLHCHADREPHLHAGISAALAQRRSNTGELVKRYFAVEKGGKPGCTTLLRELHQNREAAHDGPLQFRCRSCREGAAAVVMKIERRLGVKLSLDPPAKKARNDSLTTEEMHSKLALQQKEIERLRQRTTRLAGELESRGAQICLTSESLAQLESALAQLAAVRKSIASIFEGENQASGKYKQELMTLAVDMLAKSPTAYEVLRRSGVVKMPYRRQCGAHSAQRGAREGPGVGCEGGL